MKSYHKREIKWVRYYKGMNHPHGTKSAVVTLDCGHVKYYKGSQVPKSFAYCIDCHNEEQNYVKSG